MKLISSTQEWSLLVWREPCSHNTVCFTQYSVLYTMVFLWLPRELIKLNVYSSISHPKNLWNLIIKWTLVCQHVTFCIYHGLCVLEWEICYYRFLIIILWKSLWKERVPAEKWPVSFNNFIPTQLITECTGILQYILWKSKGMCSNKSLSLSFLNTWQSSRYWFEE